MEKVVVRSNVNILFLALAHRGLAALLVTTLAARVACIFDISNHASACDGLDLTCAICIEKVWWGGRKGTFVVSPLLRKLGPLRGG